MLIRISLIAILCIFSFFCQGNRAQVEKRVYQQNRTLALAIIDKIFQQENQFQFPSNPVEKLLISDFDHTFADTLTEIPVELASGQKTSVESKCARIPKDGKPDFSVFTEDALMKTKANDICIKRIKTLAGPSSMLVVITARSQAHTFKSVQTFAKRLNLPVSLVIPANSKILQDELWSKLQSREYTSGMKKAILIMAITEYTQLRSKNLREVVYFEDTDKYITSSIRLFQQVNRGVRFRVFDYIKDFKSGKYTEYDLGYVENGLLYHKDGLVVKHLPDYQSADCRH